MSTHEHVCGACGATTREQMPEQPRVWRSGDPEPGRGVRVLLDSVGRVWRRHSTRPHWRTSGGLGEDWRDLARDYGPLVEVVLPEPVTE